MFEIGAFIVMWSTWMEYMVHVSIWVVIEEKENFQCNNFGRL